jgi:hypothetical protein
MDFFSLVYFVNGCGQAKAFSRKLREDRSGGRKIFDLRLLLSRIFLFDQLTICGVRQRQTRPLTE